MTSTQLSENVSSTEISSQDNIGGSETSSSKQVDDYYTDGSGNTQVDSTNRATEQQTGDKDGNPAFNQAPPTDLSAYGLASREFMETGIDPAGGNHAEFANGANSPASAFAQGEEAAPIVPGNPLAYQTGGNNTVSQASGTDPSYVPPSTYQPPTLSAAPPGARKPPEIQPMSANEFFQMQNLTLGAPVSDPMMATMNAGFITTGVLGNLAPVIAPVVMDLAAPATTLYLLNAPQVNDFVGGLTSGMSPETSPTPAGVGGAFIHEYIKDEFSP